MNRRLIIVVGAIVATAAAVAAWRLLWNADAVRAGVGPHQVALEDCWDQLENDLQHPQLFEFLDETIWHQGDPEELLIGGSVRMLSAGGQPTVRNFECLVVIGRVFRASLL